MACKEIGAKTAVALQSPFPGGYCRGRYCSSLQVVGYIYKLLAFAHLVRKQTGVVRIVWFDRCVRSLTGVFGSLFVGYIQFITLKHF